MNGERAFNQVKQILGKLDRSIDEARARRLQPAVSATNPTPAPNAATPPGGSAYGRARPIPPSGGGSAAARWVH